ncbi:MAG: Uma2 family endonuclease [Chloroflexi bacterium]|nr:Uma2 family endonuclease [Chloroflexota bacterium]
MSIATLDPTQSTPERSNTEKSPLEKIAPSQPLRMSYEDWLVWAGEDKQTEWVDGEVIEFMPPKRLHQALVSFLNRVIGLFIEVFELGQLQIAPFQIRLRPDGSARAPDLFFVTKEHLSQLTPERLNGPPDLIIEIISDESVHRDRVDKFDEYEAGGVPEYWILDNRPSRNRAQFYQLDAQGRYREISVEIDGIYRSRALPGFWLKVDWLWAAEPDALRALAAVVGPEKMLEALRRVAE